MSIRIATNKTLKSCKKVNIHPSAHEAFEFINSLTFSFCGAIKKGLVNKKLLTSALILRAIIVDEELEIYSGFESIVFDINTIDLTQCTVIIDDEVCDLEIEKRAWVGVFTNCLLSSISNENYYFIYEELNKNNKPEIIKKILYDRRLSQNRLAKIIDKSRGCITKQKIHQIDILQESSVSLFEQLIGAIDE